MLPERPSVPDQESEPVALVVQVMRLPETVPEHLMVEAEAVKVNKSAVRMSDVFMLFKYFHLIDKILCFCSPPTYDKLLVIEQFYSFT